MHRALHVVTLRILLRGTCCLCLSGLLLSALGQTNVETDVPSQETLHNLAPVGGIARQLSYFLAAALLVLAGALTVFRYRSGPSLYKAASDAHWDVDAQADVGDRVDASEVM